MRAPAIEVRDIGKCYRIGKSVKRADTLFQSISNSVKAIYENYKTIRGLVDMRGDGDTLFWALENITLDVHEGEVLGVIGHNGSGKSTLLKILSRITEPTTGSAIIRGRVSSLLEVGTGFHPELTGRENIYMNGTILGMRRREIDLKLDEIIQFSGVARHIDTPVKFFSSGMKVRLGFAVAAHLEPEILIVDEVLAVGDAEFQKKCLGKMKEVGESGRTVLFVSHNLEAVRSLCTKAILLNRGHLEYHDQVSDVIDHYMTKHALSIRSRVFKDGDAPGTRAIRLTSAELSSEVPSGVLTIDSEIRLKFRFQADQAVTNFNLTLILWTLSGTCIFSCMSHRVLELAPDEYSSELVIPGGLLNNGTFSIDLHFLAGSTTLFKVTELLVFDVFDSVRSETLGKWLGAVRPTLPFTIHQHNPVES